MRKNRGLWVSIAFVLVLTGGSLAGLLTGALAPTLGLDLQGGVAVILSAPAGTEPAVMDQALENIRRRVDGFGVAEPDIFLSGTTIEVQIPGEADSTIEERASDVHCLLSGDGTNFGCSESSANVEDVLTGLEIVDAPSEVCLVAGDGTELECYGSKQQAAAARSGITIAPKASESPTPSASESPSASPTVGPAPAADQYCLTDLTNVELACYDSQSEAQEALEGVESEVRARSWCLVPAEPEPAVTSTPAPTDSATPTVSATPTSTLAPTPTASPAPNARLLYSELDLSGAEPLPCEFESEDEAQGELDQIVIENITTRFCVISSQGDDLGCYVDRPAAEERQRDTGQERLLDVIGQTARLEERPTLEIIQPNSPVYQSLPVTCGTEQEQESETCTGNALDDEEVVYYDQAGNKVRLAPVVLTGGNIKRATGGIVGGTETAPVREWAVFFELDGPGTEAFANATRAAVDSPSPRNQIAIVVDRVIVSNPVVESEILGGSGQITGSFTQESAEDLATVLSAGALPVELTKESVRTVSPTLGEESLQQGIAAGVAGLVLLLLYLLVYYRLLGVVAWLGMSIWAVLALGLVSLAGTEVGYALTLAGVAGLVISLGVTADSYIVFFERLKDEMRGGKSPRTVVRPAFKRALRTIIAADVVTGIAAFVLYVTAVSSVRGFALTLGVATGLDLFVVYFFKRPTVILIAQSPRLVKLRGFGLSASTAADHAPAGPFPEGKP